MSPTFKTNSSTYASAKQSASHLARLYIAEARENLTSIEVSETTHFDAIKEQLTAINDCCDKILSTCKGETK
jgi:hypothetical protein